MALATYCSSVYIAALVGLVLFSVVAKKYKYRERDDRPYVILTGAQLKRYFTEESWHGHQIILILIMGHIINNANYHNGRNN